MSISRALSVRFPFAQLAAFPYAVGLSFAILGISVLLIDIVKRVDKLSWLTCVVWIGAGISLIVAPYGIPRSVDTSTNGGRILRILTFNTAAAISSDDLKKLMDFSNPDVIVLPETSGYDIRRAIQSIHYHGEVFETPNEGFSHTYTGLIAPTTLLTSRELGPARIIPGPATSFGTVSIDFDDPDLPIIVAVHTAPPIPGLMKQWRDDLNRVSEFGESASKPLVIAGDFNATLRHGGLASRSRLIDSQEFCSPVPLGTWPKKLPSIFRSPIDHVFVTDDMKARSCHAINIGESDHLAYQVDITIR